MQHFPTIARSAHPESLDVRHRLYGNGGVRPYLCRSGGGSLENHQVVACNHLVYQVGALSLVVPDAERFTGQLSRPGTEEPSSRPLVQVVHGAGIAHLYDALVDGINLFARWRDGTTGKVLENQSPATPARNRVTELRTNNVRGIGGIIRVLNLPGDYLFCWRCWCFFLFFFLRRSLLLFRRGRFGRAASN